MDASHFFLHTLSHAERALTRALGELTKEELVLQPAGPDTNPIGWLVWHLTRVQDTSGSALMGKEQAWVADGWHAKFGMDSDFKKFTNFTLDEVRAFDPKDAETLLGYYQCVRGYTEEYVKQLTPKEMDREFEAPPGRPNTVGTRLAVALGDNIQHIGQIGYLMGTIKGPNWY